MRRYPGPSLLACLLVVATALSARTAEPDGVDDPVPADAVPTEVTSRSALPLTISEAKRGLALKFDIDEGDIEIIIKG